MLGVWGKLWPERNTKIETGYRTCSAIFPSWTNCLRLWRHNKAVLQLRLLYSPLSHLLLLHLQLSFPESGLTFFLYAAKVYEVDKHFRLEIARKDQTIKKMSDWPAFFFLLFFAFSFFFFFPPFALFFFFFPRPRSPLFSFLAAFSLDL